MQQSDIAKIKRLEENSRDRTCLWEAVYAWGRMVALVKLGNVKWTADLKKWLYVLFLMLACGISGI